MRPRLYIRNWRAQFVHYDWPVRYRKWAYRAWVIPCGVLLMFLPTIVAIGICGLLERFVIRMDDLLKRCE